MTSMGEGIKGPLKLAAITTAKYFMPHLLGTFLRQYPTVEPRLTITNQARVVERLRENLDDLVIMGSVPEDIRLELAAGLIAVLDVEHFPLIRYWHAVHLKGNKLSPTTRHFLDFLLQNGTQIWTKMQACEVTVLAANHVAVEAPAAAKKRPKQARKPVT